MVPGLFQFAGTVMRGDAGIYGHVYQAKVFVLPSGPLSSQQADISRAEWIQHQQCQR
jgi:hypothetical protein